MAIIGYVSVYVLLYCFLLLDSFTTCFGLLGHLQVCTCLLIFKESASLLFGHVVEFCMFLICVLFLCCTDMYTPEDGQVGRNM
jgi:hypothetical protein